MNKYVVVKKSNVHNKGVFAKVDIPKGTKIIEYIGRKITKKESDILADKVLDASKKNPEKGAVYIFELNDKYDIDGNVSWNPARFINHSCNPNCETTNYAGKHIWIEALRNIKKSEELSYNYGYSLDDYKEHPCKCGSKNCIGYILAEKYWKKIKK